MSKTLQDYLGQNVTYQDGILAINLYDLFYILGVDAFTTPSLSNSAGIVSLVLKALLETTKPEVTDRGFPVDDPSVGIVSNALTARSTIITRGDETQVRTRLEFSLYAENRNTYSPDTVIGSNPRVT